MFKIKYRIIADVEEMKKWDAKRFDVEGNLEGFFEMEFNDNIYGYYHNNPLQKGEEGFELIIRWFELLLESYLLLQKGSYIAISDIESYKSWIEFIKKGKKINVSIIENENKVGLDAIVTKSFKKYRYADWSNEEISIEEFKNELIKKANSLIDDVRQINHLFIESKTILNLFSLLNQIIDTEE